MHTVMQYSTKIKTYFYLNVSTFNTQDYNREIGAENNARTQNFKG